ncbi:MAG: 3-dehydroquinate synthase [Candidatus Omnitrophica bacterium]|nr:3-dehydroquinate synthase [Candidatus Omnitrophota bacterium]
MMRKKIIRVGLGRRSYSIVIGRALLNSAGRLIRKLHIGEDACIITTRQIWRLHGRVLNSSLRRSGLSARVIAVPDTEKSKSFTVCNEVINKLAAMGRGKKIFLIAFGGGVVGDLTGFVASIYKRGIPYIQVPTTFLGQVDSSIGGKTAIDLKAGKNLVGSFYQPAIVISDIDLIATLPKRQIRTALAEVIKYGVIRDSKLFDYVERNLKGILNGEPSALEKILHACAKIKARVVEKDEHDDKGLRVILNFGHTIGHGLEAASSYSSCYTHGEAISIGMVVAAEIAVRLGLSNKITLGRIERIIKKAGLPTQIKGVTVGKIMAAQAHDKKFTGSRNRFVLPVSIGKVKTVTGVPRRTIVSVLQKRIASR